MKKQKPQLTNAELIKDALTRLGPNITTKVILADIAAKGADVGNLQSIRSSICNMRNKMFFPKERTAEQIEAEKQWHRDNYQKNRGKILERQKKTNAGRRDQIHAYGKKWAAEHREHINAKVRERYPKIKQAEKERLAESDMIGPTEAAKMVGISLRSFRQWVTDGRIESTLSPTGRRVIKRSSIQVIIDAVKTKDNISTKTLTLVKSVNGFEVPANFDIITQYHELTEYSNAFAAKKIGFLLLVGSPGSGKSSQMKADLKNKHCTWIDNHVTNLGLYCSVYESNNAPVVLDDVNHFLKNKIACSLIKALTQTEEIRNVSWESTAKVLEDRDVPRKYKTSSPICLIANMWDATNADYAAIQDRALPVAFFPTAETIHNRVIELGWCKDREILNFVGEHLSEIPQPSMREYYQAGCYKRAGMNWKKKLQAIWGLEG